MIKDQANYFLCRSRFNFPWDMAAVLMRVNHAATTILTQYSHKNVFFIVDTKQSSRKIISRRPRSRALTILALLASHFRSCSTEQSQLRITRVRHERLNLQGLLNPSRFPFGNSSQSMGPLFSFEELSSLSSSKIGKEERNLPALRTWSLYCVMLNNVNCILLAHEKFCPSLLQSFCVSMTY